MGKIICEYETQYEVGDTIIFNKDGLRVGVIEGFYVEDSVFWFNIRVSPTFVYTYTNQGDIMESDIIGKIEGNLAKNCFSIITAGKVKEG